MVTLDTLLPRLRQLKLGGMRDAIAARAEEARAKGLDPVEFLVLLLDDELAKIARDGVSAGELAKARNLKASAFWRGMATINGKARALGTYEVFKGDYRKLFDAPARYEAVTASDVQALARKILRVQNRTTGLLKPVAGSKEAAK